MAKENGQGPDLPTRLDHYRNALMVLGVALLVPSLTWSAVAFANASYIQLFREMKTHPGWKKIFHPTTIFQANKDGGHGGHGGGHSGGHGGH